MGNLAKALAESAGPEGTVAVFIIAVTVIFVAVAWIVYGGLIQSRPLPVALILSAVVLAAGQLYDRWSQLPTGTAYSASATLVIIAGIALIRYLRTKPNGQSTAAEPEVS